jgi:hypothetical protein
LNTDYLRNVFRWLHTALAIVGAGICILLAATGGGHPPGIVLVPIAAAIWLAVHGLLWVSHKLAIRGKHLADNSNIASGKWPLAIVVLVFITGIVFIFGLFGIVWQVLSERNWLRKLPIPFAVWIPSSLCFFGILLRQDWSRILAGGGFIIVAVVLLYDLIAGFMRDYRYSIIEWLIFIAIFVLLILLGQYILRSSRIKAFFSKS